MKTLTILLSLSLSLLAGCTSVKLDNGARLMQRPDWPAARAAAPEWCRDALHTIANLEYELERQ
ncbi:hypothetical protein Ga0100231_004965 [Opitutaceae bacterium TAV4]|nr:hypothetical protein Ga0100231_004965 [Opitutaceae bacterium TAV4]RRK02346.1 hypothetical protein Ga0100230_004110 [Opitutaceae bacterium TAV3]